MRSDVTENPGALIDTETAARITFDINPETFEDSKSTELAEIQIPGMSHPRLQFTTGNARTVLFTVSVHYGVTEDVPSAIKHLQAWLYPEYDGGRLKKAPSKLLLLFGDTWPDEQWIMRSCDITRKRFDKELNCIYAEASIELVEYIEQSKDSNEVRA